MLNISQTEKNWAPFQTIQQDTIRNSFFLLGPMPSHGVTFVTLLMTPLQRMKRREYGRQWNNRLTNSMNNILVDIPPHH
jgi:hypothetical protein